jgi:hypothetical protein
VRPRGVPFDADLGPDPNGDTVAVYSRCGREPGHAGPPGNAIIVNFPDWRTGRGCDLYEFNFTTFRETRVASANGARSSEFLPSIWKTKIAFARVYERRRGRAGDRPSLYVRPVLGAGRSVRLPPGPRSRIRLCRIPRPGKRICRVPVELGPTALDLRGRRLAFGWDALTGTSCNGNSGIWLDTFGGGQRRIETTCSGDIQGSELLSPTIDGGSVHYGWALYGDQTASRIRSYKISSGERKDALTLPRRVLLWTATDATRTFDLLSGGFEPGCSPGPEFVEPGVGPATAPCPLIELSG